MTSDRISIIGVENLQHLTLADFPSLRSLILPSRMFSTQAILTITSEHFRQVILFNIDRLHYPYSEIDDIFDADRFRSVQLLVVVSDSRLTENYAYVGELSRMLPKAAKRGVIVVQNRDFVHPHSFLPALAR